MSFIHWGPEDTVLKKYSASTTSGPRGKTVIRIELETSDSYALASLLQSLAEIESEQHRAKERAKAPSKKAKAMLALPAPQLQLTDGRNPFDA
jgi:hypothetical protein